MKLNQNWRILFSLAGIALILFLIWYFRSILAYALIAVVISFIGDPLADLLKKIRYKNFMLPAWFRSLFTLVTFGAFFYLLIRLFSPLVAKEITILSSIDPREVATRMEEKLNMDGQQGFVAGLMQQADVTEYLVSYAQDLVSFSWLGNALDNVVGFVGSFLIGVFAVLFMSFFFLKDGFLFTRIVFTLTPDAHLERMKNVMEHTHKLLRRFFVGILVQSLLMAAMVSIGLLLLGVENAVLIGLFAGLVNVVPYIGPLLAACFGLLVALTTSLHLDFDAALGPLLLKVVSVFVVAQQIDGFVIQPLVLGGSVKAHPLEIFVVVLAAGTIGGVLGMVVAIPSYTILRIVAKEFLSEFKVVESLTRELTD